MRWLVTIQKSADMERVMAAIHDNGGELDHDMPLIPLDNSELIVQVRGSYELADRLKSVSDIIDVFPDSEIQLY